MGEEAITKEGTKTMDYRSMYDREYLGSWDLPVGKDVVVTISKVVPVTLTASGGVKNKKPVIYFEGKEKGFVANKTNSKAIAGIYGNDTTKWVGKRIALYATTTTFGSETKDCIRVRVTAPAEVA